MCRCAGAPQGAKSLDLDKIRAAETTLLFEVLRHIVDADLGPDAAGCVELVLLLYREIGWWLMFHRETHPVLQQTFPFHPDPAAPNNRSAIRVLIFSSFVLVGLDVRFTFAIEQLKFHHHASLTTSYPPFRDLLRYFLVGAMYRLAHKRTVARPQQLSVDLTTLGHLNLSLDFVCGNHTFMHACRLQAVSMK